MFEEPHSCQVPFSGKTVGGSEVAWGPGDSGCWFRRQWMMVQELHGVQETVDDGPGDSGRSRSCILLVTEKSTSNDAF